MSHQTLPPADGADADPVPQLEIVVPVYNEAQQLAASITSLRSFLDRSFPLTTVVTVADNASTAVAAAASGKPKVDRADDPRNPVTRLGALLDPLQVVQGQL